MTAQAPIQNPPQIPQTPAPAPAVPTYATPVTQAPAPTPPTYAPPAGYGAPTPAQVPWQASYLPRPDAMPSAAQRLSLAIVSLALMIPLVAIVVNFPVSLGYRIGAGLAIATALIGVVLLALAVIGVNLLFNWDMLRRKD